MMDWKRALSAEASRAASRGRWGRALMIAGWVHLAIFLGCQAIYDPKVASDPRHALLWIADLAALVLIFRVQAGRRWYGESAAAALVVRVWGTFSILAFNMATLNTLSGWSHDWFKPTWASLGTFGFATMAWLFGPRFLIPAVQMFFTGLLMVRFPGWNYLIYGLSWWLALQYVGWALERARYRDSAIAPEAM
jgi:hypothetical protein